MKQILHLVHNKKLSNKTYDIEFQGKQYQIIRLSSEKNLNLLIELLNEFSPKVDAIALTGIPDPLMIKHREIIHRDLAFIRNQSNAAPICEGHLLRQYFWNTSIEEQIKNEGPFLAGKKIGFFCGALQKNTIQTFKKAGAQIYLADPYSITHLPFLLKSEDHLDTFLKTLSIFIKNKSIQNFSKKDFLKKTLLKMRSLKDFIDCDAYVCHQSQLEIIETDLLKGKTLLTDDISNADSLNELDPQKIINFNPFSSSGDLKKIHLPFSIIEACIQAEKTESTPLKYNEIHKWAKKNELKPIPIVIPPPKEAITRFAFMIHPLSKKYLARFLKQNANSKLVSKMEEKSPYFPAFKYGTITGIESKASQHKVEGLIYSLFETPKMLLASHPDLIYNKILKVAHHVKKKNAKIIGLGAYTKIVGDAGVTIAQKSPIPVTTGNSLSSASTLWAADLAVRKMGFVKVLENRFEGTVMIIGATGSIGKVTTKLLQKKWRRIILIAPQIQKLEELVKELDPQIEVQIATHSDPFIHEADLIITTTSNQSGSVLNINYVKPGAVICDVSRPFDIKEEDAILRPDVLVIASGEVELPGNVKLSRGIGLEGSVVYACLAETALLALEGRFENFSLSRNLDPEKVIEIDQLARKHGVKLAAIMGHSSEITLDEIRLCRENALLKLKENLDPYTGPGLEMNDSKKRTSKKRSKSS